VKEIKEIEHEGDKLTHQTIEALNKTFVTQLDREDIHALVSKLDDILDFVDAAANRMLLYKITEPPGAKNSIKTGPGKSRTSF
jgi:uncharacterized protein Yka (UPF0111/DUF47 family)